jgi:hypothetical protein
MYTIEILDPFLKQQFLQDKHPYTKKDNSFTFSFDSQAHFIDLSISFIIRFSLNYTFTALVKDEICNENEKQFVLSSISIPKVESLVGGIYEKIKKELDNQEDNFQFDFIKFFLSQLLNERKTIKNLLYEAVHSLYLPAEPENFLNSTSNIDFIYFVVLENGSVSILDKFSNEVAHYYYNEQEEAVAKTCHLNPETLLIYDHLHLLEPELVICFKQLFRKKVTFLETQFPNYQSRA